MRWDWLIQILVIASLIWLTGEVSADPLAEGSRTVVSALHSGDDSLLADRVDELRSVGQVQGYSSFPGLSFHLLEVARGESSAQPTRASFLVRKAVLLSPADARVLLTAAASPATDSRERFEYLLRGVKRAAAFPTVVIPIAVETLLLILSAVTLSLLFLCAVQVGVYGPDLVEGIGDAFPRKIWGYAGPLFLLLLLASPIPLGIFPILIVWSATLGWFVKSSRWLTVLVGAVIIAWASSVQITETVRANVLQPIAVAVEDGATGSYAPTSVGLIARQAERELENPLLWAVLGQSYARDQRWEEARHAFGKALNVEAGSTTFRGLVYLNLAAAEVAAGRSKEALPSLQQAEQLGVSGFELEYVSALAAMANTDLAGYEQRYEAARTANASRLEALLSSESQPSVLFASLPVSKRIRGLFAVPERMDPEAFARERAAGDVLLAILGGVIAPSQLWVTGGLCVLLGSFLWWRADRPVNRIRRQVRGERVELISRIWALLPGGLFVAGRAPFLGLCVVSAVLAITMLLTGLPLHLPGLTLLSMPVHQVLWGLLIVLVCGATLLSFPERVRQRR